MKLFEFQKWVPVFLLFTEYGLTRSLSAMQFVQAGKDDLEMLRSFAERTFRIAFESYNDTNRFNAYCTQAFSSDQVLKELSHPESEFWLVFEEVTLAGYLKLNFDEHAEALNSDRTVKVERLYVAPEMQNVGLGAKMLDFAYKKAQERKAVWIWLGVWSQNTRSIRFYERCGYEKFGDVFFWMEDEPQLDFQMKKRVFASKL